MTKNEKIVMLRAVLSNFIVNERPFTSVEITNHVKRMSIWIPNRQVAEYLRENVINLANEYGIDYILSNIQVDTNKGYRTALCYHERKLDASSYLARDIKAITPDEFEAMHGVEAIVSPEDDVKEKEIFVNKRSELEFNFPGA